MTTGFRSQHRNCPLGSVVWLAIIALAAMAAACSEQGAAGQPNADGPITITTDQAVIRFENRAGLPLSSVTLTVIPYGRAEFTKSFGRVESEEVRAVSLTELKSPDGTRFNRVLSNPRFIRLTAVDLTGRQYEIEVPWRQ